MNRLFSLLRALFHLRGGARPAPLLLLFLFAAVNLAVLINALHCRPTRGYDVLAHLNNARFLAHGSWPPDPEADHCSEFFSPPLPYLVPALAFFSGGDADLAGKAAQSANVLLSLGVTLLLLLLCRRLAPGSLSVKIAALGLVGAVPAYYKIFAQARPEPYVVFFCLLSLLLALPPAGRRTGWTGRLALVLALSAAALSRQWALPVIPAVGTFYLVRLLSRSVPVREGATDLAAALLGPALLAGWFYVFLAAAHGSPLAFNRPPLPGPLWLAKPASFFFSCDWNALFSHPVKPFLENRFLPILYADLWGDYWQFFISAAARPGLFARLNWIGLFPTLLLLGGLVWGAAQFCGFLRSPAPPRQGPALVFIVSFFSLAAYLWFVVRYPTTDGDTVKAGYLLHLLPPAAVLGALALRRLCPHRAARTVLVAGILLCGALAAPAFIGD